MKNKLSYLWGILLIPLFFSCISHKENTPETQHPRDWTYRAVPSHLGETPKDEFFILLGDGLAYGKAVTDQATMAHLMDQKSLHYKVYNRAQEGASVQDILTSIDNKYFLRGVEEKTGVLAIVIAHEKLKDYLQILPKFKTKVASAGPRLAIICEWPENVTGLPSECLPAKFKAGIISEESIAEIFKKF